MNAEFIDPFLAATKNVLKIMCQTKVTADRPTFKKDRTSFGEVTGIIDMASETVSGCMVVSFSEACILKVVAIMREEEPKNKIDDEIIEAVGELTNMICGGAKSQLSKLNHKFDLAIPSMITGKGVVISNYTKAPTVSIPFQTEYGNFVVEVNLA